MELSDDSIRSIVAHLAHLRAEYGDVLGDPDLIEPNGDYFPDAFSLDPAGVDRVLRRMLTYAPLSDELDVELGFVEPEGESAGGGCGSGACGTGGTKDVARGGAVETRGGYGVIVNVLDAGEPTLLTTSLARSIGRLVLFEADEDVDARDEGALAELTAVACGFGVILLEGACVYKKGCGGMRRHQATFLSVEELAFALALFVRATEKKASVAKRHLSVTQREAFDAALEWVDGQPKLVRALREAPETLSDGVFELEAKKGLLSRWLTRKDDDEEGVDAAAVRARERASARSDEERRRIAETKALVDEALQDP
jgi:hypothetical protein